jgi:ABC-type branched-subunit amino acid transport system permease subunit
VTVSLDVIVLGVIQGLLYGLLGVALVLVYRAQRFVNFAQANLGLISSVLLGKLVLDWGLPYLLAVPVALAAAVALGGIVELAVIRRLFKSPRLVLMVASIFLAQLLLVPRLIPAINPTQSKVVLHGFPVPFHIQLHVGSLVVDTPDVLIMIVCPVLVVALAAFLRLTPYGQAIRAAAENPDAARLAGISVRRMSTLVWLIGGLIAGVSAILEAPKQSVFVLGGSGASILVRALGAALIGRMTSLPTTFVAGIGIGVLESVTFANYPNGGTIELVVFAVVMAALLWRAAELSRSSRDPASAINFGAEAPPLPRRVNAMTGVRRLRSVTLVASAGVGLVLPWLPIFGLNTAAKTFLMSLVVCYAIVGVSLCVLTGWAGQVSLGQFALVGVGAFAASRLSVSAHLPFWLVTIVAGLIGSAVAVAIGLPAVRIQGLFLAVSTMAFAVLAQGYLFQQPGIVGNPGGVYTPRPSLLQGEKAVYYFGLAALIVFLVAARNFRRSGPGRMLLAVRDNDRAARMAGVSAVGSRLVGFALAGFMATIAGVLFAYARQRYVATDFTPDNSFNMLTMVVIGGLGSLPGAVLGAIFEFGVPVLAKGTQASQLFEFLFGGVGGLVFLMFIPKGLSGAVYAGRDALVSRMVRQEDGLPAPPSLIPPWRDLVRVMRGRPVAPIRETA